MCLKYGFLLIRFQSAGVGANTSDIHTKVFNISMEIISFCVQKKFSGRQKMFFCLQKLFRGVPKTFSGVQENISGVQKYFSGTQKTFSGVPKYFSGVQEMFSGVQKLFFWTPENIFCKQILRICLQIFDCFPNHQSTITSDFYDFSRFFSFLNQ